MNFLYRHEELISFCRHWRCPRLALQEKYIVLEGVIKDFFSLLKSSDLLKFRRTILIFFVILRKRLTGEDSIFVSFFGKKGEKIWLCQVSNSWSVGQKPIRLTITPLKLDDIIKGQLISKCPFGVLIRTKIPTKQFPGFLS